MTSAHIFYVPIILFVGLLAGYFLGQRATEKKLRERREKLERRRALQNKQADRNDSSPGDESAPAPDKTGGRDPAANSE